MNLLLWATGFLALGLYLALQELLGVSAMASAFIVGGILLVLALLTGDRLK